MEHFFETLKKLEKYNIEITNWGNDLPNDYINLKDKNIQEALINVIKNLANAKSSLSIKYSDEIINILKKKEESSVKGLLYNIKSDVESDIFDKDLIIPTISV